jgi:hypothetical protein
MYCLAKKVLPLIMLILFVGQVAAQTEEEPETAAEEPVPQLVPAAVPNVSLFLLGAGLGCSFAGYREETDAPLNRNLNAFTVTINGNAEKGNFFHSFNVGFFRGKNEAVESYPLDKRELEPDMMDRFFEYYRMEDTYTRIYLEYALDYILWGNRTFPGYLGGAFRVDSYIIEKLNNFLYMNITINASLGLHASQKWIINPENILVFSADFPLFGYALRPHYLGAFAWPMEMGIVSLHNYWAVFGDLKYTHKFTSLISAYSDVGFELSMINFPKPRRDAILRLIVGVAFAF